MKLDGDAGDISIPASFVTLKVTVGAFPAVALVTEIISKFIPVYIDDFSSIVCALGTGTLGSAAPAAVIL